MKAIWSSTLVDSAECGCTKSSPASSPLRSRTPKVFPVAQISDSMVNPRIEDLLSKVDSRFTLVSLAAQRARQINAYFNQLGEGMGSSVPPQVTSAARKPLSIAFEEIAADKIVPVRIEVVEVVTDIEAVDASDEAEAE